MNLTLLVRSNHFMTLKFLDRILEQLQDDQWHSLDEIKENTSLSLDKLNKFLLFLQEGKFIDRKDDMLKITLLGLKLFKLQPEPPVT